MEDFIWSLEMTGLGMGTVFILLIALMGALSLLNKSDAVVSNRRSAAQQAQAEETMPPPPEITFSDPSGLTQDQIAAIAVAVTIHAEVRRKQAAPVHRVHAPGSRLWASRWVAIGRSSQLHNERR